MKLCCKKQHDITDCGAACLATVSKQYGLLWINSTLDVLLNLGIISF